MTVFFYLAFLARSNAAELQVAARDQIQNFFSEVAGEVTATFHNPGASTVQIQIATQLYLAGSATVIPLNRPQSWKALIVLPGQTVLESTPVIFPSQTNISRYVMQWLDESNHVLGHCEFLVYAKNLLTNLKQMTGGVPIGLVDAQSMIKPLLVTEGLPIEDLRINELAKFHGKLAIIVWPDLTNAFDPDLAKSIVTVAQGGVAIVWVKPANEVGPLPEPDIYTVAMGLGAVTVMRPQAIANLAESPTAQLNLIQSAKMALTPGTFP